MAASKTAAVAPVLPRMSFTKQKHPPSGRKDYNDDGFIFEEDADYDSEGLFCARNSLSSFRDNYFRSSSIRASETDGVFRDRGNDAEQVIRDRIDNSTIGTDEYDMVEEIERLYNICEKALPRYGATLSPAAELARQGQLDKTWEEVREWLTAHPSAQERRLAATREGNDSTAALHLVCKVPNPPLDVFKAIIACAPNIASKPDLHGWLPLHHACANSMPFDVLRRLVHVYPEGRITQDLRGRTPLHFAFFRADAAAVTTAEEGDEEDDEDGDGEEQHDGIGNSFLGAPSSNTIESSFTNIVKILSGTGAAKIPDINGMLPMHYASAYGTSTTVLRVLEAAYPRSIVVRESKGRTSLHLAMVNSSRHAAPRVVRFLVKNGAALGIVDTTDNNGRLPLEILASACKFRNFSPQERLNVSKCLAIYLDGKPKSSAHIFNFMKKLPQWLCNDLVMNDHFQSILNAKIVERWPTAILLLDLYAFVILIMCFSFTSRQYIVLLSQNSTLASNLQQPETFFCVWLQVCCGFYFLVREMIQIAAIIGQTTSEGGDKKALCDIILRGVSQWLYDRINWLDVSVIGVTFANSILMLADPPYYFISNTDERPYLRILLASTQIILWIALLFYIMSVRVGFAVFMGGVAYITRQLVYFVLCVLIFLVAFAMMFQLIYSGSEVCQNEAFQTGECYSKFPHCDFWSSLLKVYTMMMGEIGAECRYLYSEEFFDQDETVDTGEVQYPNFKDASRLGSFVYVLYAFIIVFILSTVLIAIVVHHFQVFEYGHSTRVFWLNRFDFMVEIEAISNFVKGVLGMIKRGRLGMICNTRRNKGSDDDIEHAPSVVVQEIPGVVGIVTGNLEDGGGGIFLEPEESRPMEEKWDALISVFDPNFFKEHDVNPSMEDFWVFSLLKLIAAICLPIWIIAGCISAGILWPPQVRKHLFAAKQSSVAKRKDTSGQFHREVRQLKKRVVRMNSEFKREIGSDRASLQAEIDNVRSDLLGDLANLNTFVASLRKSAKKRSRKSKKHSTLDRGHRRQVGM